MPSPIVSSAETQKYQAKFERALRAASSAAFDKDLAREWIEKKPRHCDYCREQCIPCEDKANGVSCQKCNDLHVRCSRVFDYQMYSVSQTLGIPEAQCRRFHFAWGNRARRSSMRLEPSEPVADDSYVAKLTPEPPFMRTTFASNSAAYNPRAKSPIPTRCCAVTTRRCSGAIRGASPVTPTSSKTVKPSHHRSSSLHIWPPISPPPPTSPTLDTGATFEFRALRRQVDDLTDHLSKARLKKIDAEKRYDDLRAAYEKQQDTVDSLRRQTEDLKARLKHSEDQVRKLHRHEQASRQVAAATGGVMAQLEKEIRAHETIRTEHRLITKANEDLRQALAQVETARNAEAQKRVEVESEHKDFVTSITYASYLVASCLPPICDPSRAQLLDIMQRVHKDLNSAMLRDHGRSQCLDQDSTTSSPTSETSDRDVQMDRASLDMSRKGSASSLGTLVEEGSVRVGKRRRLDPEA